VSARRAWSLVTRAGWPAAGRLVVTVGEIGAVPACWGHLAPWRGSLKIQSTIRCRLLTKSSYAMPPSVRCWLVNAGAGKTTLLKRILENARGMKVGPPAAAAVGCPLMMH
jgi:hypothetical protein